MKTRSDAPSDFDADTLRAARHMIENHGSRAAAAAEERARHLAQDGANEAAALWQNIRRAIRELVDSGRG
jgi:plasmid stabilization system protein ParE